MIPSLEHPKQLLVHGAIRIRLGVGVLLLSMFTLTPIKVESQVFGDFPSCRVPNVSVSSFIRREERELFQECVFDPLPGLGLSIQGRRCVPSRLPPNNSVAFPSEPQVWLSIQDSSPLQTFTSGLSNSRRLSPTVVFNAAYSDFLKGRYVLAISAFRQFLQDYPSSSRADQVYYYLGESYYYSAKIPAAARTFKKLLEDFPQSRYGPSALLKIGKIFAEGGKLDKAKKIWLLVIKKFPRSPESQLAQQQLLRHP